MRKNGFQRVSIVLSALTLEKTYLAMFGVATII